MFAGKKSAQIREILISESAWEEMTCLFAPSLAERGVNVDHSTIYRWVQRYAPEMEKRLRWYWRNPSDLCPWHMDETYVKVNGRWAYLYRAEVVDA